MDVGLASFKENIPPYVCTPDVQQDISTIIHHTEIPVVLTEVSGAFDLWIVHGSFRGIISIPACTVTFFRLCSISYPTNSRHQK